MIAYSGTTISIISHENRPDEDPLTPGGGIRKFERGYTYSQNSNLTGEYWYDDQGFRVRKVAETEIDEEDVEVEVLYPSIYFCIETQSRLRGRRGSAPIKDSGFGVSNIYLNGLRIAAVIPNGEARYYLTDQVDSVKVVVDDDGKAVTRTEYLPYGETWFQEGDDKNAPKYNSQELDKETNFYFYNARHYDPEIGRFVTADNVIDGEGDSQGWNRFSYVKGNPIRYKDPTGHQVSQFGDGWYNLGSKNTQKSDPKAVARANKLEKTLQKAVNKVVKLFKKFEKATTTCEECITGTAPLVGGTGSTVKIITTAQKAKKNTSILSKLFKGLREGAKKKFPKKKLISTQKQSEIKLLSNNKIGKTTKTVDDVTSKMNASRVGKQIADSIKKEGFASEWDSISLGAKLIWEAAKKKLTGKW